MSHSSSEESIDISESDFEEEVENIYAGMTTQKPNVISSGGLFDCPLCVGKKKHSWGYTDLLQHATSAVGTGSRQALKCRAKHRALAKYLKTHLAPAAGATLQSAASDLSPAPGVTLQSAVLDLAPAPGSSLRDERFVYPWMGILVNLETLFENGKEFGESTSGLKGEFKARGFNPMMLDGLWNGNDWEAGKALVTFQTGWPGFNNAMSFEEAFEADHHGKSHWLAREPDSSGTYGWVARDDDYNNMDLVGKHLRKCGGLKTIKEIKADEERDRVLLMSYLASMQDVKKQPLSQRHSMETLKRKR